jgi:hypothetical protein
MFLYEWLHLIRRYEMKFRLRYHRTLHAMKDAGKGRPYHQILLQVYACGMKFF